MTDQDPYRSLGKRRFRTVMRSVLVFSCAALIGPGLVLLSLVSGMEWGIVREFAFTIWPFWGALPHEPTSVTSSIFAYLLATAMNVLVYAFVGRVAAAAENMWWKGIVLVLLLVGTWYFVDQVLRGSITVLILASSMWIGTLALSIVLGSNRQHA